MPLYTRKQIEDELAHREDDLAYYRKEGDASNALSTGIQVGAMKYFLRSLDMNDLNTEVKSREPTAEVGSTGWYCVIGPNVMQNHPITRTWKKEQESAAKHAEKLINDSFDGSRTRVKRLLVVKVVEVIEVSGPPISRRRGSEISADDVGETEGE